MHISVTRNTFTVFQVLKYFISLKENSIFIKCKLSISALILAFAFGFCVHGRRYFEYLVYGKLYVM